MRGTHSGSCGGLLATVCLAATVCFLAASTTVGAERRFELGVQTHFSQGWNTGLLDRFDPLGARAFRDGVSWETVERSPGVFDFQSVGRFLERAHSLGLAPLIVFAGANPLYDEGQTPYSDAGRRAFSRFVAETIRAFPKQLKRIEIGNEYNAPNFRSGPFDEDPERLFALMLEEVHSRVRATFPNTEILCSGAHSVAIGYFRLLFEHGALDSCDAISLHPYRGVPEQVDSEIFRLRALMRDFGGEKPIHVTEFGQWFEDPADAPDFMLKMVSLLDHAEVDAAYWYALVDEPWWPNMGLVDARSREKPAAKAFRFLQTELLPRGRAVSRSTSPLDHVYEFGAGSGAFVAWGAPADLHVSGPARYYDAEGEEISPVSVLSDSPVVIIGDDVDISITRKREQYDSLYQFNKSPWSYYALSRDGEYTPLETIDGNWASFIGHRYLKPLAINEVALSAIIFDGAPLHTVERFTAPAAGRYEISGSWRQRKMAADGADVRVSHNGEIIASEIVREAELRLGPLVVDLAEGDRLEFMVGPNREVGGDVLERRIRIAGP